MSAGEIESASTSTKPWVQQVEKEEATKEATDPRSEAMECVPKCLKGP